MPNVSNAHERTKFRNLISAQEVLSVIDIQEMCVLRILQMWRSQALCVYVLFENIGVKVQRCEGIKLWKHSNFVMKVDERKKFILNPKLQGHNFLAKRWLKVDNLLQEWCEQLMT